MRLRHTARGAYIAARRGGDIDAIAHVGDLEDAAGLILEWARQVLREEAEIKAGLR